MEKFQRKADFEGVDGPWAYMKLDLVVTLARENALGSLGAASKTKAVRSTQTQPERQCSISNPKIGINNQCFKWLIFNLN